MDELKSPFLTDRKIRLLVARLDLIHPVISGNKLFKLLYFLRDALQSTHKKIITFGGPYSNHLLATAYACKIAGIQSIAVIRGEEPVILSTTLVDCKNNGMDLTFITREEYAKKDDPEFLKSLIDDFGAHTLIPEGGFHPLGAAGASLIMKKIIPLKPDYICTAVGTATTLAGIINANTSSAEIVAIPVLKNMADIKQRIQHVIGAKEFVMPIIWENYHEGGYAKKNDTLIQFMNDFYEDHSIPTDFVYTAKMFKAVFDKIMTGFFKEGSTIICLHTGGLQGNASLPPGTLVF